MLDIEKNGYEKNGSMTVETALVMPLFLFLLINLISLFEMIYIHSVLDSALNQVGREISTYAYVTDAYESVLLTEAYVKERVVQIAGRDKLSDSVIIGGTDGIVLWRSEIDEDNDVIDLVMTYRVSPRLNFFEINEMVLVNRCYIKAYTGYEKENTDESERRYYVADTGDVYHTSRSCTHLQLSISAVDVSALETIRNEDGSRYKACEVCYDNNHENGQLYITTQGDRYHSSIACTGLKRTIYIIKESELGGKPMCLRCMEETK